MRSRRRRGRREGLLFVLEEGSLQNAEVLERAIRFGGAALGQLDEAGGERKADSISGARIVLRKVKMSIQPFSLPVFADGLPAELRDY